MRTEKTSRTYGSVSNGTGFHVRPEDAHKLSGLLIDTYSHPTTPVREIIVNAMEVQPEGTPVKVDFSSEGITVTDRGPGMDREFMETYLCGLMASTKENEDSAVGGFGIGSKSVMSISNRTTWRSVKDGTVTTLVMTSESASGTIETFFSTDEAPGKESGTSVYIECAPGTLSTIRSDIGDRFLNYVPEDKLSVSGIDRMYRDPRITDLNVGEVHIGDRGGLTIISDGFVPYHYDIDANEEVNRWLSDNPDEGRLVNFIRGGITVRMSLPRNRFTPNREALVKSRKMDREIIETVIEWYTSKNREYREKIINSGDLQEWSDNMRKAYRAFGFRSIYGNGGIPVIRVAGEDREKTLAAARFTDSYFSTPRKDGSSTLVIPEGDTEYMGGIATYSVFGSVHNSIINQVPVSEIYPGGTFVMGPSVTEKIVDRHKSLLPDYMGAARESEDRTVVLSALTGATVYEAKDYREIVLVRAREIANWEKQSNTLYSESNGFVGEPVKSITEKIDNGEALCDDRMFMFPEDAVELYKGTMETMKKYNLPFFVTSDPNLFSSCANDLGLSAVIPSDITVSDIIISRILPKGMNLNAVTSINMVLTLSTDEEQKAIFEMSEVSEDDIEKSLELIGVLPDIKGIRLRDLGFEECAYHLGIISKSLEGSIIHYLPEDDSLYESIIRLKSAQNEIDAYMNS